MGSRNAIYIGGKSDAKNREWLEQRKITHILNVTPPKEAGIKAGVPNYFESSRKFVYKRIPVYDASTSDLLSHANEVVRFLSTGLIHGSVLVHCQHGVSRSATCVAFYLMRKTDNLTTVDAVLRHLQQKRPQTSPIPAFQEQLKEFQKKEEASGSGTKRKLESSSSERSSKRSQIGPQIGPSLGPSIGPQRPPTGDEASNSIGPSIGPIGPQTGPSIGPSIGPQPPPTDVAASNSKTLESSEGLMSSKRQRLVGPQIGPQIGPSPQPPLPTVGPLRRDPADDLTAKDGTIGPKFPPQEEEASKVIGPALPPT